MSSDRTWAYPWGWSDERERSAEPLQDDVSNPQYQNARFTPACGCGLWCWCDPGQLAFMEDYNG